jgi:hypothetical protein
MHQSFTGHAAVAPTPRIAAILGTPEAVACPNMARRLAYESAAMVEQARDSLVAAQAEVDKTWSGIAAALNATLPAARHGSAAATPGAPREAPAPTESADDGWAGVAKTLNASLRA